MKIFKFVLLASLLLISVSSFALSTIEAASYLVIVDAGSTGSRIHIFKNISAGLNALPVLTDIAPKNNSLSPGISDPQGDNITPLLDTAVATINADHGGPVLHIPFYLYGTAGMRLMDPAKQQQIYQGLTNLVSNYTENNQHPFMTMQLHTIPGEYEALFDWLAANYLAGTFIPDHTLGSMDMGGASTEIAFVPQSAQEANMTVSLAGTQYHLFAVSFLKLGQDQARAALADPNCYPNGYADKTIKQGKFDFKQCQQDIDSNLVLNPAYHVAATVPKADPGMTFVATSGYFYNFSFFLPAASQQSPANLMDAIQTVCNKSWSELQQDYPSIPVHYLSSYCFNGSYAAELMTKGYHFAEEDAHFEPKDEDWPVGAALYLVSQQARIPT